jgi:hypothetical protein
MSSSESGGNLGGISGADTTCNTLADSATSESIEASFTFVSWLSNDTINAKDRIPAGFSGLNYFRTDGIKVADNFADLIDGSIDSKIDRDENEVGAGRKEIWIGTTGLGTCEGSSCNNWISSSSSDQGRQGKRDQAGEDWTNHKYENCDKTRRICCFQVS